MRTLIDDLLAYTHATQQTDGPVTVSDTASLAGSIIESFQRLAENAAASITCTALPPLLIREVHLIQLFQNLIGNALKYRGNEAPRVEISAAESEGWWTFSVADNGIGVAPEFSQQIFGLFKRLHTRDQYPGSGIGLAVCQRIVEQYGGRIWLEKSTPGQGSVFCFSLPAVRVS